MSVSVGSGEFTYRVEPGWAKLPDGWQLGDVGGVAVDSRDRVYIFHRGPHPMIVLDRDGNFLNSWGDEIFKRPHAVSIGPDDTIYCTDDLDHTVRKCTLDGKVLLQLGTPGKAAPAFSGQPFHAPTHTALSLEGDIYVTDGYGNSRVHRFSPDGRLLSAWGEPGTEPGQFNIAHNICVDRDGWVFVADRENHRVQVFSADGKYETQWNNLHRPCAFYLHSDDRFYVGELGPMLEINLPFPNIGPRISILNHEGALLERFGGQHAGTEDGSFIAPHGIAIDSRGDMYVGEVSVTSWNAVFPGRPKPPAIRTLQKLVKTAA